MGLDEGDVRLIILDVHGMTCGSCEQTVKASIEQLKALSGDLAGVLVSKEEGSVRVLCRAGAEVSSCALRACVEMVGFDAFVCSDSVIARTTAPVSEQLLAVALSSSMSSTESVSSTSSQNKGVETAFQASFLLKDTVSDSDLAAIESVVRDLAGVVSVRSSSTMSCISIDYLKSSLVDASFLLGVLKGVGVAADLVDDAQHSCAYCTCVRCRCCKVPTAHVGKAEAAASGTKQGAGSSATYNPLLIATNGNTVTVTIAVTGMTCSSCSGIVERTMLRLGPAGVVAADVNLSTNTAKVVFIPSAEMTADFLRRSIEDAGYGASVLGETAGDVAADVAERASVLLVALRYDAPGAAQVQSCKADLKLLRRQFVQVFEGAGFASTVDLTPEAHHRLFDRLVASVAAMWDLWRSPQAEEALNFQVKIEFDERVTGPRDLLRLARQHGFVCSVQNCGGFMTAARMYQQQRFESSKMMLLLSAGLAFTIPIIVLTMILPMYPAANARAREPFSSHPGINAYGTSILLLSSPVYFIIGSIFHHKAAVTLLRSRAAGMDFLISSGSSAAYLYSFVGYCRGAAQGAPLDGDVEFFETSAVLITVVILGKCLEIFARAQTAEAIYKLSNLRASTARLVTARASANDDLAMDSPDSAILQSRRMQPLQLSGNDDADVEMSSNGYFVESAGDKEEVDAALLHVGDIVRLVVGESAPADGVFMSASIGVDESMMTGESVVLTKRPGAVVFGGTRVVQGGGLMRVTACGDRWRILSHTHIHTS